MASATWKSKIADILGITAKRRRAATLNAAQYAAQVARLRCPVRTGHLRSSIHLEVQDPDTVFVVVGADYGIFVEMGTSRMAPRPFIAPALDAARQHFQIELQSLFR